MRTFQNILLVRAGSPVKQSSGHPVHHPAPLALKYSQAILEQGGFRTHILDYWVNALDLTTLLERMDEWHIDTVVVDISSPHAEAGIRLCAQLKEHRHPFIVITGSDVSEKHDSYLALKSIYDVLLRGEYEVELGRLMTSLRDTKDKEPVIQFYNEIQSKELLLVEHLDDLPPIRWDRQEVRQYPYTYPLKIRKRVVSGYVSTSRGCPHGCTFCSPTIRKSYGRLLRRRSPQKVVDDIEALAKMGVNMISFEDDDFTLNKDHVRAICGEIISRDLKVNWACHARIDEVTPELLAVMKAAGCALLLFGIESGAQRVVNVLHKAAARDGWRERATSAFRNVRRAGIASCAMFIVGSPTENLDDVNQSISLAQQLRPDLIKVHFFTLYPGSVDYRRYGTPEITGGSPYHYRKPIVNLSNMDMSSLKQVQRRFYRKFLLRPSFLLSHFCDYLPFYFSNIPESLKLFKDGLLFLFTPVRKHLRMATQQAIGRQSGVR